MIEHEGFSEAQNEAIQSAYTILSEHFEHALIVVDSSIDLKNGHQADAHEGWWYGGSMAALGLAEYAKDRILRSGKQCVDPRNSDDDQP